MKTGLSTDKNPCSQPGYTLAEVMIAVAALALVGLSLFTCFSLGWLVIKTTREDLRATQIMTQKIESIRLLTWSQLNTNANFPTTFKESYNPTNSSGTVYVGRITRNTNFGALPAGYRANACLITVSVTWTNYRGQTPVSHFRQMQTISAYDGMQNYLWGSYK